MLEITFEVTLDTSELQQQLAGLGDLETVITNDATSPQGFPYFHAVDTGRGPVFPRDAKALKIPVQGGNFIFRKSAKAFAGRHIVEQSLPEVDASAVTAAAGLNGDMTIRQFLTGFLNRIAAIHSQVLARLTPRGPSGKLASNYRSTVIS